MGTFLLVGRLAGRDVRRRPAQAVLLLLAITAATATLALGLALNGVTSHPYQQTRAATNGPDLVAGYGVNPNSSGPDGAPAEVSAAQVQAETRTLTHLSGVTEYSGPYPVASAILRTRGLTVPVQAEGRTEAPAAVDQPKLTAGSWVRPGGVVIERTFAEALGAGVGDRVTLDGRPFTVTGIAVTAAAAPYPNCYLTSCMFTGPQLGPSGGNLSTLNVGLTWVTEPDARALAAPQAPLSYVLDLKLKDPAAAPALQRQVLAHFDPFGGSGLDSLSTWQEISAAAGQLVQDQQGVLGVGAVLAVLLAVASVAVLAGGRMTERTRRVGLLKAVGSTPGLVAAVLMAENLALAVAAAAAGLVIGWAAAPLITNPGAGLIGTAGAPSLTPATVGLTVAVALAVALASSLVPAVRAARSSTASALADSPRPPRRRAGLIALSARLPVPLLLGARMAARRLRRAVLGAASIAVTSTGIVAVLTFRATVNHELGLGSGSGSGQIGDPVVSRDTQMLVVITTVLVALAVLNAVCAAWATVQDSRRSAALARALGASPRQVSAGVTWAQVLPALPGALLGIPLGLGLFLAADHGGVVTVPPAWWLAAAVLATLAAVAAMASIPARAGARRPAAAVLQAETT